jgi:hypothetical protein
MSTSSPTLDTAIAKSVQVTSRDLIVELHDGRTISVPVEWYPRLAHGSPQERQQWELIGPGIGIHWPVLDEDISIEGLLRGLSSGESAASLKRWLAARRRPANHRLQPTKARRRARTARGGGARLRG